MKEKKVSLNNIKNSYSKMKEQDVIIIKNILTEYIKVNKKMIVLDKIEKLDQLAKTIYENISNDMELFEDYKKLIVIFFKETQLKKGNVLMHKLFKEEYEKNPKLFNDFIYQNLKREFSLKEDFQIIGTQIKEIITKIENELLSTMEKGKYAFGSSTTYDKFYKYIKIFYPYYDNIGVTIRNSIKN